MFYIEVSAAPKKKIILPNSANAGAWLDGATSITE
jgi:hypothetical protein